MKVTLDWLGGLGLGRPVLWRDRVARVTRDAGERRLPPQNATLALKFVLYFRLESHATCGAVASDAKHLLIHKKHRQHNDISLRRKRPPLASGSAARRLPRLTIQSAGAIWQPT